MTERHEVVIDTRIATAYDAYQDALVREQHALATCRTIRQSVEPYGRNHRLAAAALQVDALRFWASVATESTHLRARTALLTALEVYAAACRRSNEACAAYQEESKAYDGWSRFFLVTSSKGHVHSSMRCYSCLPTTTYAWLPQLSGLDEADAVDDQGGILCTMCFPSAPVAWTAGISKADAAALAAREAERLAREAAKAAKAITTPEGDILRVLDGHGYSERLDTVVAAERWYVSHLADAEVYDSPAIPVASEDAILRALAHKYGHTVEAERVRLDVKVTAKVKRDLREVAKAKAMLA